MSSMNIGDPCPGCGKELQRRKNSFYWRGTCEDAAFCFECNAIWAIKNEEIKPLISPSAAQGE